MSFKAGLMHVLRHCWLWPIRIWVRPLDMMYMVGEYGELEAWTAVVGGAIWVGLLVLWIWLVTEAVNPVDFISYYILETWLRLSAIEFVFFSFVVCYFIFFTYALIYTVVAFFADIFSNRYSRYITSFKITSYSYSPDVGGSAVMALIVATLAASAGSFIVIIYLVEWYLDVYFKETITNYLLNSLSFIFMVISTYYICNRVTPTEWGIFSYFIALPIAVFFGFNIIYLYLWFVVILVLFVIFGVNFIFNNINNLWKIQNQKDFNKLSNIWSNWLTLKLLFALMIILASYLLQTEISENYSKKELFSIILMLTPSLTTGLLFWPILVLIGLWQFSNHQMNRHNQNTFINSLPFQWQSFIYPLPGLRSYLKVLSRSQGSKVAFSAIQALQFASLQITVTQKAAFDLASQSETALPFCGCVAVNTNSITLTQLSITGIAAQAVAVLRKKNDLEEKNQPLLLYVGDYPPKTSITFSLFQNYLPSWLEEFEIARSSDLPTRINFALKQLEIRIGLVQGYQFRQLLEAWLNYTNCDVFGIIRLPRLIELGQQKSKFKLALENPTEADWIMQGWNVLRRIAYILSPFRRYNGLSTQDNRRLFLKNRINDLQLVEFNKCSLYWQEIGKELAALWAKRLEQEIQQAREWLRLEIRLAQVQLPLGIQTLLFIISNPTQTSASKLRMTVEVNEGLEWLNREGIRGFLEGGGEAQLRLGLETLKIGSLRIAGKLEAEDFANNVITVPFVFQVRVAEAGKPYKIPPYQPYVIGEGLGEDRTFVGREDLLHWLRGLWLQPQGKPAVALVGQRRIGKTSLLNKISRDGLPDTGLLPVLVNVQGLTGDYDFLNTVAREMAEHLEIAKPLLDRANPYPDFKDFLLGLKPDLNGRRFLLMLDEADLIPQRGLGEDLPGFLRGLMQEPQYPVLLLFCGTHALKQLGREYYSILFNTAQFRTVSYMTQAESAQVLQKPAGEWLEYDRAVLEEAYRLTKGQPLLLQSIGAKIINHFDEETRQGRKRPTFVNFNDLNAAAEDVVKQGNAAFENHWESVATAEHRFLAGLAWATDETDRLQMDIIGIEAALRETRLSIPDGMAFKIAERLSEEDILTRAGPDYRFAVPLYRRWVAWRWPIETVSQERTGS